MARPIKLNPETQKKITDGLSYGLTRVAACGRAGITYRCFMYWLNKGKEAESGEFLSFFHAVELSENEATAKMETLLIDAAQIEVRYALEWLKRRRRAEWGDSVNLSKLDDETLIKLLSDTDE